MSDIVERNDIATGLRQIAKIKSSFDLDREVMIEAAAEIERLRAINSALVAALEYVKTSLENLGEDGWSEAPHVLRVVRGAIAKAAKTSLENLGEAPHVLRVVRAALTGGKE